MLTVTSSDAETRTPWAVALRISNPETLISVEPLIRRPTPAAAGWMRGLPEPRIRKSVLPSMRTFSA
ncbi:MAG: hypothetical protein HY812_22120 [Planctomycetes bacterium]|nr:hypothetical protein [Planctomycetota bacterium]